MNVTAMKKATSGKTPDLTVMCVTSLELREEQRVDDTFSYNGSMQMDLSVTSLYTSCSFFVLSIPLINSGQWNSSS